MSLFLAIFVSTSTLSAQNFPPSAKLRADSEQVPPGATIRLSARGSKDPDNSPKPLTYQWDFGDGTGARIADVQHHYQRAGTYVVTLTVSDGEDQSLAQVTIAVLPPATSAPPAKSTPLTLSQDERVLAVVNPDSDSISLVDLQSSRVREIPTGRRPRTVALSPDGSQAWVTNQDDHTLSKIDCASGKIVSTLRVGHHPYGIVRLPGRHDRLLVTNQGNGTVMLVDGESNKVLSTKQIGGMPRAAAVTAAGDRGYVTDYLTRGNTGTVTALAMKDLEVVSRVELAEDPGPDTPSSGRGFPNLLSAIAVSPAGEAVWVGGLKSNTGAGLQHSGEPLEPTNRVRGMLAPIDSRTGLEDPGRRIDLNNADSASALAFSPDGRIAYVTHQGAGTLSAYDLAAARLASQGDGAAISFLSRIDVGHAPQGIVVTRDGKTAFVSNFLSRNIVLVDLTKPGQLEISRTIPVTAERLSPQVARGKQLFYRSKGPELSEDNYTACASCHADGGMSDGRTWDFTQYGEGLRNTIDLRGRGGMRHGPVHWSANFDEIQDFEHDIVHAFGGKGLLPALERPHPPLGEEKNAGRSADLDSLAAYLATLTTVPPSPHRTADGQLTAEAIRGRKIFYRGEVGCARCHVPPRFTDSIMKESPSEFLLHDVGTVTESSGKRLGEPLRGLDTPTLLGLWGTPPYLHDGRARSLMDALTRHNPNDRHGVTSHLSLEERHELIAFLLSIDGRSDLHPNELQAKP